MSKVVTISEGASIGLHAMVLITRSQVPINVLTIAKTTSSSKHYVAKVLQLLVKTNFISSSRGPTGGYFLKKIPKDISMLDIYEAIEGKIEISNCPLDKPTCPFGNCIFNNITQRLSTEFQNYLESQTLDMYIGNDKSELDFGQ